MIRNRVNEQPRQEAANTCLTCPEPKCDGGHRGCPYSVEYGLKHKPPYLMQESCGYKEPYEPDDFYYK